ncbi:TPA: hypothetical protein ACMDUN_003559, partial [Vibrio cholerae]
IVGVSMMYEPQKEIELLVRKSYEAEIFGKFKKGTYDKKEDIGSVLKTAFEFYNNILTIHLNKVASIDMLAYVLSEYDHYYDLSIKYKKNELSEEEKELWNSRGSRTKRAIKFLAEKIVKRLPNNMCNEIDHHRELSYCWIAAEEMVALYMASQVGFSLFPDDCVLTISDGGNYNFIEFRCKKLESAFEKIPLHDFSTNYELSEVPPFDVSVQNDYFKEIFIDLFNIDYASSLALIQYLINCFKEEPSAVIKSFNFQSSTMIPALSQDYSEYGVSIEQISNLLGGFSLSKEKLKERLLYKPKQEYRALRRAFFEVEDKNEKVILFSKSMALEELSQLIRSVCFRKLPSEWLELNKGIEKSLANFSNYTGSWFEDYLIAKLKEQGFECERSLKKFKVNGKNLYIPDSVGDIDIVAKVGDKLHIIECKMVQFASEPNGYLDDFDKFIKSDKSYKSKFNKKIRWVKDNIDVLRENLLAKGWVLDSNIICEPFMVTFYPTIVSQFISDFNCLDINTYINTYVNKSL